MTFKLPGVIKAPQIRVLGHVCTCKFHCRRTWFEPREKDMSTRLISNFVCKTRNVKQNIGQIKYLVVLQHVRVMSQK